MREWERQAPVVIVRGRGPYLYGRDNRQYLDGVSSIWVNLHGHRVPEIDRAIVRQLGRIAHSTLLGLTHPPAIALARELVRIAPRGLRKVFFSDDGSTAVEAAIKIALQYWQHRSRPEKNGFVGFAHAYHGDTLGAVSVGGIERFHGAFRPLTFTAHHVAAPYCYRCPLRLTFPSCRIACLDEFERLLRERSDRIAAVVVEPGIQAAAGIITPPPGHLRRVADLCRAYDVLLIADEVATGFGRTGRMFACDLEGVTPDLMAIAKGLTGGYLPLAATLTTRAIYDAFLGDFEEFKTFYHGHSYTGNPLGCAAALANLERFKRKRVLAGLRPRIRAMHRALDRLRSLPAVGDIRQRGLVAGIELVQDRATGEPFPVKDRVGTRVTRIARDKGLLLRPLGDVIVLMPPLNLPIRLLEQMVRIVGESIEEATQP